MLRFSSPLLLFGLALLGPTTAGAQTQTVERSCTGSYFLRIVGEEGGNALFTFHPALADIAVPHRFSGRASCGTAVPNRCRRRASERLLACMAAQATNLGSGENFPACSWNVGVDARRVTGYFDYRLRAQPFSTYLQPYLCTAVNRWFDAHNAARAHAATLRFTLHGVVKGDKGCGGGDSRRLERLLGTFSLRCPRQHNPRSDVQWSNHRFVRYYYGQPFDFPAYDDRALPAGADSEHCRQTCLTQDRCVAWTYDRPTAEVSVPHCRLFDELPTRLASSRSDSGAK